MASSLITGLCLLLVFYCRTAAAENLEEPYGCDHCCIRIDNQTTILHRISDASDRLTKDVGEIKTGIVDDISSQLKKQAVDLVVLKTSVGTNIPSQLEKLATKASVDALTISLKKHSEDLLQHDARLKEQGLLLGKLSSLINEIHDTLVGPKDCSDIRAAGYRANWVYRVYPSSLGKRIQADAFCDMTTPGGSWLVIQRRRDGSENFARTWSEYQNGFGNPWREYWLGNEALYLLTSNRKYKLRIDMEDFDGQKRYAEYSTFSVGPPVDRYRLTVGGYKGNAGDSFTPHHNGMRFSTKDVDSDLLQVGSCAQLYRGGWWYNNCHASNPNGLYLRGPHKSFADGIEWYTFRGHHYSLKITEMKIAPVN